MTYLAQAFIQADKLLEGVNCQIFIRPPTGYPEDPDTVYKRARAPPDLVQLSAPTSTTHSWRASRWKRCRRSRNHFLRALTGRTKESRVTSYLCCELIRDCVNSLGIFRQSIYAKKILQLYGSWAKPSVKTLLEQGTRLSKADSAEFVDPELHRLYCCITGHLSFLIMMTRCYLAFAYAELSKFVQAPGEAHMKQLSVYSSTCVARTRTEYATATRAAPLATDFWAGSILTVTTRQIPTPASRLLAMFSAATAVLSPGRPNARIVSS
eukprot:2240625-Rhodomonas_salina.1